MTLHKPIDDGGTPKSLISEAMVLYETAAAVFSLIVEEARDGDKAATREAIAYAKEYRQALQTILNERATVEKLRKQDEGIVYDYALDFEAARDEIGRRLARLRDAGNG